MYLQWYYNNQAIKPSKYFQMTSKDGVHTLHITGAFPEDQGVYKCQALNQAGEVTCIAHLKVNGEWVKVIRSLSRDFSFSVNIYVIFHVDFLANGKRTGIFCQA